MNVSMRFSRIFVAFIFCLMLFAGVHVAAAQGRFKVTILGTGTPDPNPERFNAAILVEAGGKRLMVDCGRGTVTRLAQAGVDPAKIDGVFITHLHYDHTVGLPDLWLTGWLLGRSQPVQLWGPAGTRNMAQNLARAFNADVQNRVSSGALPAEGAQWAVHDIARYGEVYNDGSVRISAFPVDHGAMKPALGYRVDYAGHSVVISGDTRFSQSLVDAAKGTDCLIHAAWSVGARNSMPADRRSIASAEDVARVFTLVHPKLAVIYHYQDEQGMEEVIGSGYKGPFVIAKDLMAIEIGSSIAWKNGAASGRVQ